MGAENLRARRSLHLLGGVEQLLVELLSRPETGDFDRVAIRIPAGQPHQIPSQVEDPNGLAHVQHEEVRAATKGGSIEDQPRGFWDCHEESCHFRVRHGEGLSVLQLLPEDRNNAAR